MRILQRMLCVFSNSLLIFDGVVKHVEQSVYTVKLKLKTGTQQKSECTWASLVKKF